MTDQPPTYIRLTKLIKAPRQAVYDAWLDPESRRQWWCAAPEYGCNVCEIDPTQGGRYRVNMEKDGEEYVTVGEFTELDPPRKLAFTWTWEKPSDGVRDTIVTIELYDAVAEDGQPATELVLTHDRLPHAKSRELHTGGWAGCLESLAKHFDPA